MINRTCKKEIKRNGLLRQNEKQKNVKIINRNNLLFLHDVWLHRTDLKKYDFYKKNKKIKIMCIFNTFKQELVFKLY